MKITVNPATQASGNFGFAPEGEYQLRVVEAEVRQGKNYPYIAWSFEFVDPNVKTVEEGKQVGKIFENTTLKEDSQFGLRNVTDALGLAWGEFDTDEVKGMTLSAKVGIEEYEGTRKNVVEKFIPVK